MTDKLSDYVRTIAEKLNEKRQRFGTAESCTGGLIAKNITDLPGISSVFSGSVVSYANEIKEKLLGVKHETLKAFGAVSEQTAREMAAGALSALGVDFSVAVTGIAGPDGGTAEKPVGLVFIACAGDGRISAVKHVFSGDRASVRAQTAEEALRMLLDFIG